MTSKTSVGALVGAIGVIEVGAIKSGQSQEKMQRFFKIAPSAIGMDSPLPLGEGKNLTHHSKSMRSRL